MQELFMIMLDNLIPKLTMGDDWNQVLIVKAFWKLLSCSSYYVQSYFFFNNPQLNRLLSGYQSKVLINV